MNTIQPFCVKLVAGVVLATYGFVPLAVADDDDSRDRQPRTAIFAGGCFWSMESDFEKAPGVLDVVSGYSGGRSKNPTYDTYHRGGHREVVLVTYDPTKITYSGLVEFFIKHIDPVDRGGSFIDRGLNYSPAIYFADETERTAAISVVEAIDAMQVYRNRITVPLLPRAEFWPAEFLHQDYHRKQPAMYATYRINCGRDSFVQRHWGDKAKLLTLPGAFPEGADTNPAVTFANTQSGGDRGPAADNRGDAVANAAEPWKNFTLPAPLELRRKLSRQQFQVTQDGDTEPAFRNSFWNHSKAGLYVDIVSGEPLFASFDKFNSGTGWPSFTRPIEADTIVFHQDRTGGQVRVEVRSKYGKSHLGHVFGDGPPDRGGLRFCINSAALKFIPVEKLRAEGYGAFAEAFQRNGE